jgi:Arc/MetJ-type ribon-helix-helix transcriptional regulator
MEKKIGKMVHVRFEQIEKIKELQKKFGYVSFSEFIREAIVFFAGWLEGNKK